MSTAGRGLTCPETTNRPSGSATARAAGCLAVEECVDGWLEVLAADRTSNAVGHGESPDPANRRTGGLGSVDHRSGQVEIDEHGVASALRAGRVVVTEPVEQLLGGGGGHRDQHRRPLRPRQRSSIRRSRGSGCDNPLMLSLPELVPIVLVHGGFYDDPPMTGTRFWSSTGVVAALRDAGVEVVVHERPAQPGSWAEESDALARTIEETGHQRVGLVAGSNGCSVALRLIVDQPDLVARTMLCWPATAGDPVVDELARVIISDVHDEHVAADLLTTDGPIRGTSDADIRSIGHEVVIYPSLPENKIHQRTTVFRLLDAIPGAILVGGSPEPPDTTFGEFLESFVAVIRAFSQIEPDD